MKSYEVEYNDYYMRGRALLSAKKYMEAEKCFRVAIEKKPTGVEAYMALVHMFVTLKQFDKAKENIKKILVIDDKNGEAYFHLGNIAYFQKDAVSARNYYSKALSYGCDNVVAQYCLAMSNLETGDIINAKFYLNQIIQSQADHPKARIKLIEIAAMEKKYDEMLAQADELILNRPDAFEGYHYKFMALMSQDNIDAAGHTIAHALKLFPGDYGFAMDLIIYYIKTEKYEEALEFIENRFVDNDKAKEIVMPQKAKILFKMTRFDEAKEIFDTIKKENLDAESYYIMIMIELSKKCFDNALKYCEILIKDYKNNEYVCAAMCYKAVCLKGMSKLEEAKAALNVANQKIKEESIKQPGNISLFLYRVMCETELENYEEAFKLVEYITDLTGGNIGEIYLARGILYNKLQEFEKAKQDFDKAKSLNGALSNIIKEIFG